MYQYCFGGQLPSEERHLNEIITDDRSENLRPITAFPDTELTQAYLRKAFYLDHKTGELCRWIETQGRLTLENRAAGTLGDSGRWEVYVLGQLMRRHQFVYLYVHGRKIPEQLNHINGDLTDDRPSNLRPVTISQRRMSSRGKLGRDLPKGVCQQKTSCPRPFIASIKLQVLRPRPLALILAKTVALSTLGPTFNGHQEFRPS